MTEPQAPPKAEAAPRLAKPLPSYLADRYRAWRALRFEENRAWYARLAEEGQRPRAMVISCCDSRVDVVGLFGGEPGDLFVLRNVANLVPPHEPSHSHHGTSAAVEYAVVHMKVANIVVVGHSQCGGVAACHDLCAGDAPELSADTSFIGRWMEILRPGYERVAGVSAERAERVRALEFEAVLTSIRNLEGFPFVAKAVADGALSLHGAWIDIASGRLHVYSRAEDGFAPIPLSAG